MSTTSLEQSLRRLALRPSSLCQRCRRTFATSSHDRQQRSATASFADMLENNKNKDAAQPQRARVATASPPQPTKPQAPSPLPTSGPSATPSSAFQIARDAIREASSLRAERERVQQLRDLQRNFSRKDLEQQISRRWKPGDVYAPHDLSGTEMAKWKRLRRKPRPKYDVMDQLGINPLHHYKNFSIMSEYMSEMGRIKHHNNTSLRPVNQRRMAKAIRRAIGIGLMPGVHRHPEILRLELEQRQARY